MSRPPSPATELKTAKRLLNKANEDIRHLITERNTLRAGLFQSQCAVEDWKRRFDALLKILPASDGDKHA